MTEHAFLPPSSAGVWRVCAMWPAMNKAYPETEPSESAAEGTAAHEVLFGDVTDRASNGVLVTEEMHQGARQARAYLDAQGGQDDWITESTIKAAAVHELNWGTPDAVAKEPGTLHIADYKFGYGVVDPSDWWQGINYAALVLVQDPEYLPAQVKFHIMQPRAYHADGPMRSHTLPIAEVVRRIVQLRLAAWEAVHEPKAVTGAHCEHCPGRGYCEALRLDAMRSADVSMAVTPHELPPEALGIEALIVERAIERLEARRSGLQVQVMDAMSRGAQVPGWIAASTPGRERWTRSEAEMLAIGTLLDVPISKQVLLTPKQARDEGLPPSVAAKFSERGPSKIKAVIDDGSLIRKVFGDY